MPGILTGPGLESSNDAREHADFANAIADATGIDPRVVYAWSQLETGGHPYGGYHNWLNLRPYPGDPYAGVSPGNFEEYRSVKDAETAAIRRIRQPFAAPILASVGSTPADEISAIASTGWDAGHYGGTGGPSLLETFRSIYPNVDTGSAALGKGKHVTGTTGGGVQPGGLLSGITSLPGEIARDAEKWAIRIALILLGTGLAIIGLYLIARAIGAPSIAPIDRVTTAVTRGRANESAPPRRKGDAAIDRGEPVTRTGPPERRTRSDKRQARRNASARQRAASERVAARDRAFGGDDDIPF